MKLLNVIDEDLVNYKLPSMTLEFPYCSFKCNVECGKEVCQNSSLQNNKIVDIEVSDLIDRYLNNPISKSIVMQGLEPFDSYNDLLDFVISFRDKCSDDIIIYTGYAKYEVKNYLDALKQFENIIIKFGRYMPGYESHYDEILGVKLVSDNQYAIRIENI